MSGIDPGRPYSAYRSTVASEWLDFNEHVNDSAYAVICAAANELLLDDLGLSGAYRSETGCSMYTVEAHLRYLREVGADAVLRAESTVVAADTKRLRVHTQLYIVADVDPGDAPPGADDLAATSEHLYLHVDQTTGRVSAFPPDRQSTVDAAKAAHADLERPAHLGLGVGAPRPSR